MLSFNDERDNIENFDSGRLSNNLETVSKYACNKNLIHYKNRITVTRTETILLFKVKYAAFSPLYLVIVLISVEEAYVEKRSLILNSDLRNFIHLHEKK